MIFGSDDNVLNQLIDQSECVKVRKDNLDPTETEGRLRTSCTWSDLLLAFYKNPEFSDFTDAWPIF